MNEIMGYPLIRQTISVRVPSEEQAIQVIDELKQGQDAGLYKVGKSGYVFREKKQKGVVVESWYVVTCQKDYE